MIANNQPINTADNKNILVKKQWSTPAIVVLDSYHINATKHVPQVHEHTGKSHNGLFYTKSYGSGIPNKSSAVS